jgi:hypothetical protein
MIVKMFANFEEALDPVIEVNSDKKIEVVIDYLLPEVIIHPVPSDTIRFVVTIQPEGHFNELIRDNQRNYNYLLTFIPELLTLPKAKFFIGLTPFCRPNPSTAKIFGVSCVFSSRNCLPGHKLRHELWRRKDEIIIPKYFYTGLRSSMTGGIPLPAEKTAKEITMQTMFHICIDSFDYENSFSEKLIDPLISKVIPIYWGAKNLKDFFDIDGIGQVNCVDDIIRICNSLNENDYNYIRNPIKSNYLKALQYVDYGKQLQTKIQEVLNENT